MVHRVNSDIKSAEMNVSDLELFKKSKIIEIGFPEFFLEKFENSKKNIFLENLEM